MQRGRSRSRSSRWGSEVHAHPPTRRLCPEGTSAVAKLEQSDSQRPDVRCRRERPGDGELLRCRRRPSHEPAECSRSVVVSRRSESRSPVGPPDLIAIVNHDVVDAECAMHEASAVNRRQKVGHFCGERDELEHGARRTLVLSDRHDDFVQKLRAENPGEYREPLPIRFEEVHDRHEPRMQRLCLE